MKLSEYEIQKENGLNICPICAKTFKPLGLSSHFYRNHDPEYVNRCSEGISRLAWNKGLTKNSDPRVAKNAESVSKSTKGKSKPALSEEHAAKIGASMTIAHAEGRAHNIGKSRWNNEPSYPEKFFMRVIENEFEDKDYVKEHSFGRFSLDFAWLHLKKVIEIDGDQHQRFQEYKDRDARKDKELKDNGWQVHRVVWKEMYADTKEQIRICKEFIES